MLYPKFPVLVPLQPTMGYPSVSTLAPGYVPWEEATVLMNNAPSKIMTPQDEFSNRQGAEGMFVSLPFLFSLFIMIVE